MYEPVGQVAQVLSLSSQAIPLVQLHDVESAASEVPPVPQGVQSPLESMYEPAGQVGQVLVVVLNLIPVSHIHPGASPVLTVDSEFDGHLRQVVSLSHEPSRHSHALLVVEKVSAVFLQTQVVASDLVELASSLHSLHTAGLTLVSMYELVGQVGQVFEAETQVSLLLQRHALESTAVVVEPVPQETHLPALLRYLPVGHLGQVFSVELQVRPLLQAQLVELTVVEAAAEEVAETVAQALHMPVLSM